MPGLDAETPAEKPEAVTKDGNAAPATLPVIGIIYPPPEVRNIVDKTASFVARNGPEFESRIRQNELGNPKFNFLSTGDPYHAYYQHKVKEFREGRGQEVSLAGAQVQKSVTSTTQQKQQELLKQAQTQEQPFVPKDPPPEYEFTADPPSISALDLDIVKLTAQFVARNGRTFLTNLMNREQRNYQFDFLRPQHSLFQYFTKLLEQYTKILIPPKDLMARLKEESINPHKVLELVKYRADWQRHQEAQKRKEEMIIERERIAYAQIDWHDFVVVETVDYQVGEIGNFPPPTTPEEVGARVLMLDRVHKDKDDEGIDGDEDEMQMGSDDEMMDRTGRREDDMRLDNDEGESAMLRRGEESRAREGKDNTQVEDMDEESSDSDDERTAEKRTIAPPLQLFPPGTDKVVIKKGYDPKLARQQAKSAIVDELISPFNGVKIPANKVQEHMRIALLDPRWVEQHNYIHDKLNQESVYAPGSAIEESLKHLAERRTDIFGVGDEETAIGKKIGEEDIRKDDKITWDGHTSSVEAATRAARANITIEDQIHQIHKVKGLLPDEEKEKIGPKPVLEAVTASSISKPPSISMSPAVAKAAQLAQQQQQQGAQLPGPPGMMPGQPTQVMLVPQMPNRPPMMDFSVPQVAPVPQVPQGYQMMPAGAAPVQNYVPAPPQPMPPMPQTMPPMPPVGMKHGMMDKMDEEPVMKKARTEDSLEPEESFLAKFQGAVTFKVVLPNMPDKNEWRLNGQTIELSLPLEDPVSVIKAKIHETTNMPPGKQKLNWEGLFLKDSNSLAYYNMMPSTVLQLQLKERGGRKK